MLYIIPVWREEKGDTEGGKGKFAQCLIAGHGGVEIWIKAQLPEEHVFNHLIYLGKAEPWDVSWK